MASNRWWVPSLMRRYLVIAAVLTFVIATVSRAYDFELARGALSEEAGYGTAQDSPRASAPGLSAGRVGDQGQQASSESAASDEDSQGGLRGP